MTAGTITVASTASMIGPQGPTGPAGASGATGATGPQGPPGAGATGGTATVTVPNARYEHEQMVAAVGVTAASRITLSLGAMNDQAENAADMLALDTMGAIPGTDTLTVMLSFCEPTSGAIPINWSAA